MLKEDKIVVWTINPPVDNRYWKSLCKLVEIRTIDKPKLPYIDLYTEYEQGCLIGDYLRTDKLYEYGGIYIDVDTLTLKDFSYLLGDYEVVIPRVPPEGLAQFNNHLLMSKPKSEFMRIARDRCMSVLSNGWTITPHSKKRKYVWGTAGTWTIDYAYEHYDKKLVRTCPPNIFSPFVWSNVKVFQYPAVELPKELCVLHYYAITTRSFITGITSDWIKKSRSAYAKLVKSVLSEEEWRV